VDDRGVAEKKGLLRNEGEEKWERRRVSPRGGRTVAFKLQVVALRTS
jgi:hypothetical protein